MTVRKYSSFILTGLVLFINSCQRKEISSLLNFQAIENKFKYENLKEFSIDNMGRGTKRHSFYTSLDSISFHQLFQDTTQRFCNDTTGIGDNNYFYSKQKNKRGLIELAVFVQREGVLSDTSQKERLTIDMDRIIYNLYDPKGKRISSFTAASVSGNGDYYEMSFGKFINDSTYELLTEDNYYRIGMEGGNTVTNSETTTHIKYDGTIVQSTKIIKQERQKEDSFEPDGDMLNKLTIEEDSTLWMMSNIRKDHLFFGYERPDTSSKKMLVFSVFTYNVQGNPFHCPLGAYYQTSDMGDMVLKYVSDEKSFIKVEALEDDSVKGVIYIEKKWIEPKK